MSESVEQDGDKVIDIMVECEGISSPSYQDIPESTDTTAGRVDKMRLPENGGDNGGDDEENISQDYTRAVGDGKINGDRSSNRPASTEPSSNDRGEINDGSQAVKNLKYEESKVGQAANIASHSLMGEGSHVNEDDSYEIRGDKRDLSHSNSLLYGLTDVPPLPLLLVFALQQACLAISSPLGTTAIVAQAVCAQDDLEVKVRLLSSTMIMMGLSTFLMTTVGVKLPIFQGPYPGYIIPIIILASLPEFACPQTSWMTDPETNSSVLMAKILQSNSSLNTTSETFISNKEVVLGRIQAYAGSLMLVGFIHCLVGLTGLLGVIARYVGPVTIVPVVLLFGIYIHRLVVTFSQTNWTVASITAVSCIVLGMLLTDRKTPIPTWSPRKGFRIVWSHAHQNFSILIAILIGWLISFIMTASGAISNDPTSDEYTARTDARSHVISETPWVFLPYPGQFGAPGFSTPALITFIICTVISILDSLGDYYATARAAQAPPPPPYALNRGVAVEGLMSFLSGALGCSHATVSYSENIGAIGLSRVASRGVFQVVGIFYILLAILGKAGAVLITIPDSVIGGSQIVTFGLLIGVILSYLQLIDLSGSRNVSVIGVAIMLGMMLPYWAEQAPAGTISTGMVTLDNAITVCISNPSFVGGVVAVILDNLIPGTLRERGILTQTSHTQESKRRRKHATATGEECGDSSLRDVDTAACNTVDGEILLDNLTGGHSDVGDMIYEDRYDVSESVYRISGIPNFYRRSKLNRIFPIFDKAETKHKLTAFDGE